MPTIALFGTSADPPTTGHQAILNWLSQHYDWVAVWAANNPFKSHQTPLEHRATMLRLLIESMNPPRHNISLEPELSHPRTLVTVERARQRWQTAELTLVIGTDLVAQLPKWYHVEELLQQVKLLVVPRSGYPVEARELATLRQFGTEVTIADLTAPDVSSTAYRNLRHSESITPPIEAYIQQERLYAWQDAPRERLPIH